VEFTYQEIGLPPNSRVRIYVHPFGSTPPTTAAGQVGVPSRTLLSGTTAVSFKAPTTIGKRGTVFISTSGLATMHTLTFNGVTQQGQTPRINYVVGPSGLTPGQLYTVQIKTNDGSNSPFYLDVQ
jgi:hypothetical protein